MCPGRPGTPRKSAAKKFHDLQDVQLIDMGDFAGGMLKYLRDHPVPRVTVAGGVAKMTKLAQGLLDLHSKRGAADLDALASVAIEAGASGELAEAMRRANTVAQAFEEATARRRADRHGDRRRRLAHGGGRAERHRHRARNPRLRPRWRADGACALQAGS